MLKKTQLRIARHHRIRAKVSGTAERPRLAIFRSATHIYAQIINDVTGTTLCSASDLSASSGKKTDRAINIGNDIAKKAIALGITMCVFDRGGFMYTGRVKALADAARASGLVF